MESIRSIRSRTVVLASTNIDTDQIMPARFLTTTSREGLGRHLFADWRYDAKGQPLSSFALNDPKFKDAKVLVAGPNIGCGSSREHAPWGLLDYGFEAVVSSQIADIFKNNCLKNGLLPIVVDEATHARLIAKPGMMIRIDISERSLTLDDGSVVHFPLEPFAQYCLLNGIDEAGFLLSKIPQISEFEQRGSVD